MRIFIVVLSLIACLMPWRTEWVANGPACGIAAFGSSCDHGDGSGHPRGGLDQTFGVATMPRPLYNLFITWESRTIMSGELSPIDKAKFVAAKRAADYVEDGMRVGLGTGSTAAWLVRCLGEQVREGGLRFKGVPTSTRTADLARDAGIEVISLDEAKWLDLTIDGADEFDGDLNLIKGGGGALLQEKIVATASDQMVVIADIGKEVEHLGAFPLPIEVIPFGWQTTQALVEETLISMDVLGRQSSLRMNGQRPFITDEGNYILDLHLQRIGNPRQLSLVINQMPGVVENGLFIDICDVVVVGYGDGRVEVRDINEGTVEEERLDFMETDNLFSDLAD